MNIHSFFERGAMLAVVAVGCFYLAGYAVLRMQCSGGGGTYTLVSPRHVSHKQGKLMISFYKPLFHAESRLTGHEFYMWPSSLRCIPVRL